MARLLLLLLLLPPPSLLLRAGVAVPQPGDGAPRLWSRASTFCPTVATASDGGQWLSFLWRRPDGRLPALLVQSAWDPRGRLLACAWRTERPLARWYRSLCAGGGRARGRWPQGLARAVWGPELRRKLETLEAQRDACTGAQQPSKQEEEEEEEEEGALLRRRPPGSQESPGGDPRGRPRVRRGWTMPGTLWCGAGDSAGNTSELGVFQGPDVCCREHDLCEAQIAALTYKYGMRNYRLHTISHCDCDERFRQCLRDLNDPISNFIAITFFNLLEVPCFVLEESEECLEWHWWGGCKSFGPMLLARLVEQSHYQPLPPTTEGPRLTLTLAQPGRWKGKGRKHPWKKRRNRKRLRPKATKVPGVPLEQSSPWGPVAAPTPVMQSNLSTWWSPGATSSAGNHPPLLPTLKSISEPGPGTTGMSPTTGHLDILCTHPKVSGRRKDLRQKGKPDTAAGGLGDIATSGGSALPQSCSCYQRLDQCLYRIAPGEVKYQLHNVDSRTLFHCNCTRQLARFLRRNQGPNEVEGEVLSDYVSTSCFLLHPPPGCLEGQEEWPNCIDVGRAIVTPAHHLTHRLLRRRLGPSLKVKRQEQVAPPGGSFRLFDKCLQLSRASRPAPSH